MARAPLESVASRRQARVESGEGCHPGTAWQGAGVDFARAVFVLLVAGIVGSRRRSIVPASAIYRQGGAATVRGRRLNMRRRPPMRAFARLRSRGEPIEVAARRPTLQPDSTTVTTAAPTARLAALGQSIWLDNITRTLLDSGTLARYIAELSVTGLTSNPTIFEKAIGSGDAYDAQVAELAAAGRSAEEIFFECAIADLARAADLFAPVFARTHGVDGWVSLEVSPLLANDTAGTVAQAVELHARAARPNLYIKVPGTPEGCPAIEELIFRGVPVNVTLLFSREQYLAAAEAYIRGVERRVAAGLDPRVESVASVFISRWDRGTAKSLPAERQNTVGIAMAGRVLKAALDLHAGARWQALVAKGARAQRVLWASTGTKDPALDPSLYVNALGAPDTVNTIPEETLLAFAKGGNPVGAMPTDGVAAEAALAAAVAAGVDLDALAGALQVEGRDAFNKSWSDLLSKISAKRDALASAR